MSKEILVKVFSAVCLIPAVTMGLADVALAGIGGIAKRTASEEAIEAGQSSKFQLADSLSPGFIVTARNDKGDILYRSAQ